MGTTEIRWTPTVVSGYHRKHAIRLLSGGGEDGEARGASCVGGVGRRIYDEAVREALIVTWEAADRICGKRLKVVLPDFVASLERHGHLDLDPDVREGLFAVSAATMDRMLSPVRSKAKSRRKKRKISKVSKKIPVRTSLDWGEPDPGFLEIDFVAHCGRSMSGSFIHTLVATDISSGWTDSIPLLAREQSIVVEALGAMFKQMPFQVLGIDCDNDSAFINETLVGFCEARGLELTRSRPYHKNDQAWVEQKNGAVIRRMVGYERFSGLLAGRTLEHLYEATRLYVNYFQPSFKLREKIRDGGKTKRIYHSPATPCERLLQHESVDGRIKEELRCRREQLDPIELLHRIREVQQALATLLSPDGSIGGPGQKTLDQFLSELPEQWRSGEARATHRSKSEQPRHWRTWKDPFDGAMAKVVLWLQRDPDSTAKALFERLQSEHPGRFPDGQLRTFQRRIKEWRQVMAKKLVYTCVDDGSATEAEQGKP